VENTQLEPTQETGAAIKPRVIVIGKHSYILENIMGLLKREGLDPTGLLDDVDELPRKVLKMSFEVLLLGGGIDPHVRGALISSVQLAKPECHIVEHFGGPATIINEISEVLSR
jgi:hypothetical protein